MKSQHLSRSENSWEGVEEDIHAQHDLDLSRRIGEVLERHYPGHFFLVEVDSRGGIAHISIPILTENWRYNIPLPLLHGDPSMRMVVKAGGEILERWRIPRSGLDVAAFRAAMRHKIHGPKQKPPT